MAVPHCFSHPAVPLPSSFLTSAPTGLTQAAPVAGPVKRPFSMAEVAAAARVAPPRSLVRQGSRGGYKRRRREQLEEEEEEEAEECEIKEEPCVQEANEEEAGGAQLGRESSAHPGVAAAVEPVVKEEPGTLVEPGLQQGALLKAEPGVALSGLKQEPLLKAERVAELPQAFGEAKKANAELHTFLRALRGGEPKMRVHLQREALFIERSQ